MKWASVYSLRPDWNFAKICHLIFDKLDAKFINPLLSLYFDELYLFLKTNFSFKQLIKRATFFHKALLHFILMSTTTNQRHQSAFIFLRRRPEIRRSQSLGGHLWSPGYYMSTSGNMSKETVEKHINNEMKKAPYRAWQGQSRGWGKNLPQI